MKQLSIRPRCRRWAGGRNLLGVWLGTLGLTAADLAPGSADSGLVPRPAQIEPQPGTWRIEPTTRIVAVGAAYPEALRLSQALSLPLGWPVAVADGAARTGDLVLTLEPGRHDLGLEGYELRVGPEGARLEAHGPAGLFYGGVTLRQLLPAAVWRRAPVSGQTWTVPAVRIVDRPRFAWRGLLLDPARHFIAKSALFELIDAMAMHKLNRLQLHLTDDQGWRVELRSFPRLTARSAWRDGTLQGHASQTPERYTDTPHGGYYSQEDVRELVAYAAARHVTIVPEIEMPGHAGAWLAAYPEFAVFPERAARLTPWRKWGVSPEVLAPRPATVEACRRILDEICELFPSEWIHTGGDEAPRDQWRESREIQDLLRGLGLRNEDELQGWFTAQISRHLATKGRRLVGWDEILAGAELGREGGQTALATNAIVMSWRGVEGGQAAAQAGHDAIMAPTGWTYLDYYQGPPAEEPLAIGGSVSLGRTYSFEPIPSGLPAAAARRILGAQAQVWGEYLPSAEAVGYMAFPRACALAEVCWSPVDGKSYSDFLARLARHVGRLQARGVSFRPLARRQSLPDAAGRIVMRAADAVIHGTEVVRGPEGAVTGWKQADTVLSWLVEVPRPGAYSVRALLGPGPADGTVWIETIFAGSVRRADRTSAADALAIGKVEVPAAGPYVLFLRAGGKSGPEGFATVQGVELDPGG